ncbi:hypothetical protein [Methyloversatilis sp.]|uniref:hypothetical protein n=1 Tax=Methyloversatilis sp. TaxID=2569862 RepID=UPI003F727758
MSEGIDHQAERARLIARQTELRNEYMEAIRQQDMAKDPLSAPESVPTARAMPQVEADLALVDQQINDMTRAQEQAMTLDLKPTSAPVTELLLEGVDKVAQMGGVVLEGALNGAVGQQIAQAVEHVEMHMKNRGMLVDALADSHINSKEAERENALLDEVRRVDLDPQLGKTLETIDQTFAQKKQELDGKLAALQEKFDERHADKSADEKLALQAKLDKQFDELRMQLEKAQELERQRAVDAQAREQTARANAVRDARDDPFGR